MKKFFILIISCFILFPFCLQAKNKEEWKEKIMSVYKDMHLDDSSKIVKMAGLTFDYCIYYRIMDKEVQEEYLRLMLPLLQKNNSSNLKVYLYKPIFFVAMDAQRRKDFNGQYTGFVERSTVPLIRHEGWMMLARGNMDQAPALNYLFKALNEIKDPRYKKQQSDVYLYISYFYSIHGNYANQLKYAQQAVGLAGESGDIRQMIDSWKDLGAAYFEDPENKSVAQALEAYLTAKTLFDGHIKKETPVLSDKDEFLYMEILVTLGSIYQVQKNMGNAIAMLEQALQIAVKNGITVTEAFCHKELGILYQALGNKTQAEKHYLRTEKLIREIGTKTMESNHIQYEIQLLLADLYRGTGHYKRSAAYYEIGIENYRRMFDEQIADENQRVAAWYEARKQEEDIAGLENIISLEERQKYYYWCIAILLVLVFTFIFRLNRYRITTIKQHGSQLEKEACLLELDRAKAELQARLKQEEAQLLQQKLVTGNELLDNRNTILQQLKPFISDNSELQEYRAQIESILIQQNRIENNVSEIKTGLHDVPIDFYVRLQKQADNKLTPLDLKYCRLIYLKTPSKEMAELLFVDPKTIRVSKYRLKQKLKLGKDEDLSEFIGNIIPVKEPEL